MTQFKKLQGLYLVVAPILHLDKLLVAAEKALKGGVDIMQFAPEGDNSGTVRFAGDLSSLARQYAVPILINGNLSIAKEVGADGLHLDSYDITPDEARQICGKQCIVGYTLRKDLKRLKWAETMRADYVSFCSIFPTSSATQCEIVPVETVKEAKHRTTLPVFAAGGITPQNAHLILETGVDGIAVTSGILKAKDPEQAARSFKEVIRKY